MLLIIVFILVALMFNMANRNLAGRNAKTKKSRKQILLEWEEFERKYPPKNRKDN